MAEKGPYNDWCPIHRNLLDVGADPLVLIVGRFLPDDRLADISSPGFDVTYIIHYIGYISELPFTDKPFDRRRAFPKNRHGSLSVLYYGSLFIACVGVIL